LSVQVYRREGIALAIVAAALTLPVIGAGLSLMTIDSPYTCCWGWALVLGHRAIFGGKKWAWPATGLMVGLGILAKYNMAAWIPSAGFFLLFSPEHRQLLWRPGFWIMTAIATLCCLPILFWNVKYEWVTFRHVQELAGLRGGPRWFWEGPVVYIGAQCGLYLVFWFLAWAAAMFAHRPWKEPEPGLRYLWWLSAPMFAVFLLFSFKTGGGELNWPVTAYISGLVLATGWVASQLRSPINWYRRLTWTSLASACFAGLTVNVFMLRSDWLYRSMTFLAGPPSDKHPLPLRKLDPTCRLRGWQTLAARVDHIREELKNAGQETVIVGAGWSLPGELGFYCAGHPVVYSIGPVLGDRRSQYDLWHPNPIGDQNVFKGRIFIIVGADDPQTLQGAFDRVEQPVRVTHYESGQPIACWSVIVAHGFRGFPLPKGRATY
jgi:4-amino-4-deoxy-L-arabinose transferase-like glycosyltransferase